jgi:hypothetical protein
MTVAQLELAAVGGLITRVGRSVGPEEQQDDGMMFLEDWRTGRGRRTASAIVGPRCRASGGGM